MNYSDLIDTYGNANKAAKATGFTRQAISSWKKRGRIPFEAQYRIEMKSRGRLRATLPSMKRKGSA